MADQKCMAILLGLISCIIACIQLHVTMLKVHGEYMNKYNEDAFRLIFSKNRFKTFEEKAS